jgi:hypothetical protein
MTKNFNIYERLPQYKKIKLKSGVDRYGFSVFLQENIAYRISRRTFADWVHGWIWDELPNSESLQCEKMPRNATIIVRNLNEKSALQQAGFIDVRIGGLPFAYIKNQNVERNYYSLIAFPAHSAESEKISKSMDEYFDYLYSLNQNFDEIYVSIHYLDLNGPIHQSALRRGLKVIPGARPDDANSLIRMRLIFESFQHVTSNIIGSHVLYALYAGCNFSFSGPIFKYDESIFLSRGNPNGHSKNYVNRLIEVHSENYIKNKFIKYFHDNPKDGVKDINFAAVEIGEANVMSDEEIVDALGWSIFGQMRGYYKGARRHLSLLYN